MKESPILSSGRHTLITELVRIWGTLPESQKLARYSDIKMTRKYVHVGIDDQANALADLPAGALHFLRRLESNGVIRGKTPPKENA
jgi:hypothetical protein